MMNNHSNAEKVLQYLERIDPNGDYDLEFVLNNKDVVCNILRSFIADGGDSSVVNKYIELLTNY